MNRTDDVAAIAAVIGASWGSGDFSCLAAALYDAGLRVAPSAPGDSLDVAYDVVAGMPAFESVRGLRPPFLRRDDVLDALRHPRASEG